MCFLERVEDDSDVSRGRMGVTRMFRSRGWLGMTCISGSWKRVGMARVLRFTEEVEGSQDVWVTGECWADLDVMSIRRGLKD